MIPQAPVEQFDVVDTHDNLTGELTIKIKAHNEHILHRCVAVFVFDFDEDAV